MKKFGIFLNPHNNDEEKIIALLKDLYSNYHLKFVLLSKKNINFPDFISKNKEEALDIILVFGGDGTILKAKDFSIHYNAPILGINTGNLGFLSEITPKELGKSIQYLLDDKYKVQTRMMLKVYVKRDGEKIYLDNALNDVVIYKGITPKLINISIYCNDRNVVETRCDGLILSTPTGSTAYSLSAGGPILSPIMDAIVVAPLNPHVLTVRPMVFSSKDMLSVKVDPKSIIQIDGQNSFDLKKGDRLFVTASEKRVNFIKLGNRTFFQILRKKFHMGKK